jgi:hypothetical protein
MVTFWFHILRKWSGRCLLLWSMSKSLPEGSLFQGHLCAPCTMPNSNISVLNNYFSSEDSMWTSRIFRNILKDSFTKSVFFFFLNFKGGKINVFLKNRCPICQRTRVHILTVVGWLVGWFQELAILHRAMELSLVSFFLGQVCDPLEEKKF